MPGRPAVAIVFNRVAPGAPPEEADVLVQVEAVKAALEASGHACGAIPAGLDLDALLRRLEELRPDVVFNLVEALAGSDRLISVVPSVLEHARLPFTGASAAALTLTTSKPMAKAWLRAHGLPTPDWWTHAEAVPEGTACIVKSAWQQASLGIDDSSVVTGASAVGRQLGACRERFGGEWLAERFVDGREISASLLAGPGGPQVLPLAEIRFRDFPPGKPRIVGWRAKWDEASFESRHTPREFLDEDAEGALARAIRALALRCWALFGLRGYARVDFRVDAQGRAWVLEVNANPCLSPDAGFAAALARAAIPFGEALARILADARPAS
jgi:D-alanine-D-alanine ligase